MNSNQLRDHIIIPTLKELAEFDPRMNSKAAVDLMMGTAAQESHLGEYIIQLGGGPALGIYQMEPATHESIWDNYLNRSSKSELREIVFGMVSREVDSFPPPDNELITNPRYSTAMGRIKYWYVPDPLPEDLEGRAAYWKKYYNTPDGAGTVEEYIANYERFVK